MPDSNSPDIRAVVQRMIDAGEPEENIATVIRAYKPAPQQQAQPSMNWSRIPDPDGAMALSRVAEANPGAAVSGAVSGLMPAAFGSAPAALQRIVTHPVTGGMLGAYEGYKRHGLLGALEGGVLGASGNYALGSLGRIASGLSRLGGAAESAQTASLPTRLVLTPAEIAAKDAQMKAWQAEAQMRGMRSAAQGGKNWLSPLMPGQ